MPRVRRIILVIPVGLLLSVMLVAPEAAAASSSSSRSEVRKGDGGAKEPSSVWSTDPRSGAALNRLAARHPTAAPPDNYREDPRQRILQSAINNPGADATAQDTQSETTIGVLGSNVIIGWNDSGSFNGANNNFTGFGRSSNSGLSFTDKGALPASGEGDAGDPVLAVDQASGWVYMSTLGFSTGENI